MKNVIFILLSILFLIDSNSKAQSLSFEPKGVDTNLIDKQDLMLLREYRSMYQDEKNKIKRLKIFFDFLIGLLLRLELFRIKKVDYCINGQN